MIIIYIFKDWRELLCCCLTYRSLQYSESLLLSNGQLVRINSCPDENLRYLLERLANDIMSVMKDLKIDNIEMACLKCILLFDPGIIFSKFENNFKKLNFKHLKKMQKV